MAWIRPLIAAILLWSTFAAGAQPVAVRGITLGVTTQAELAKAFKVSCRAEKANTIYDAQCFAEKFDYGDLRANRVIWSIVDNKVIGALMFFGVDDLNRLMVLLNERFGSGNRHCPQGGRECGWYLEEGESVILYAEENLNAVSFGSSHKKEPMKSRYARQERIKKEKLNEATKKM